jgi:hypothetical protein
LRVETLDDPFLRTIVVPGPTKPLSFTGAAGAAPIEATSASAVAATASNAVKRNIGVLLSRLLGERVVEEVGET